MAKRVTNVQGFFGETKHYDEHGRYLGSSRPGILFGETTHHYDAGGRKVGYSTPNILFGEGETHYDANGNRVGYSVNSPLEGKNHYTADGRFAAHSGKSVLDPDFGRGANPAPQSRPAAAERSEETFTQRLRRKFRECMDGLFGDE